jgi:hypothetical protein
MDTTMTAVEMHPAIADGFGFIPDPHAVGLESHFYNVRKSEPGPDGQIPINPDGEPLLHIEGYQDGMIPAVSIPRQHEGESLEQAWVRIGAAYQVARSRDDWLAGPSNMAFHQEHFSVPAPKEALLAVHGEELPDYTLRLRREYIHVADTDEGFDLAVDNPFSGPGGRYDGHFFSHDTGEALVYGYATSGRWDLVRDAALKMLRSI